MIEVRELRPDDWQMWRRLRQEALSDAPAAFGSTLAEWTGPGDTEGRWRARLTDVPFNVIVWWRGIPAGMVGAYVDEEGTVELISMWVAPFARGRGVADAAVSAVLDWAGGRAVGLSVKVDNQAAIKLYRRHGFADAGRSPDDAGERRMLRSMSMNQIPDARDAACRAD
ncbi:GNAT family N-acetyltransferase [Nocardia sp. NBC_01327]|uniref:GNAT family N-acetyltransferase n=1 Tax=Nocardia sp. NBC_01327 TaxID=2903593 RepID=UPI002E13D4C5|nr:GNAT family N-acetyltransferase [Nocardia sp. NBC_01327]